MPTQNIPLDGPINLLVRIGYGSVTIETGDDLREASVRLEAGEDAVDQLKQISVEMCGPTLQIVAPRQGGIFDLGPAHRARAGVDVHVLVPTGTAVKVTTVTAPITIDGRVGGADVAFGSGAASVGEVDGDLRLRFGSGTAKATRVGGSVEIRSGSGDCEFGEIGGELRAGCGSGDLHARVVHGAVRSRCGSGAARLAEVHGDVDFASGSGGLELGIPTGVIARVDLRTGGGQVRSELPIDAEPRSTKGSIMVRARTGNGDVRVFRAA